MRLRGYDCTVGGIQHCSCAVRVSRSTNSSATTKHQLALQEPTLRKDSAKFDFNSNCFPCGTLISMTSCVDTGHLVETIQRTLRKHAMLRNDQWDNDVSSCVDSVIDLPAAEACYHSQCRSNFRTGKCIPSKFSNDVKQRNVGRPTDEKEQTFFKVFLGFIQMLLQC